jgi:hypothetical protein
MTTPPKRRRRTQAQMASARRRREAARKHHLKTRHRMTPEQYAELLVFQEGLCPICRRARGVTRALSVDHDHGIARAACTHPHEESCQNCWRGLLCSTCNKALAHARDDVMFFYRAIDYLTNPPARLWHGQPLRQMARSDAREGT